MPPRRRVDPFSALLVAVIVGMALTLGYQLSLYHGRQAAPVAERSGAGPAIGG